MANALKKDHEYLYRRVRLKAIIHILFGTILLFFPAQAPSLSHTPILSFFGVAAIGAIYLLIGIMIVVGLFNPKHDYRIVKAVMLVAAMFNTLIFFSLFAVFFKSKTTAFFMVIYGYLTYNIWYITNDPGWRAILLVKRIMEDDRRNTNIS